MRKTLTAAAGALVLAASITGLASPAMAATAAPAGSNSCGEIIYILNNLTAQAQEINLFNAFTTGPQYAYRLNEASSTFDALIYEDDTCPASDIDGTDAVTAAYRAEVTTIQAKAGLVPMIAFDPRIASAHHSMEDILRDAAPGATVEPTFVNPF
jgi:hypothetical protein